MEKEIKISEQSFKIPSDEWMKLFIEKKEAILLLEDNMKSFAYKIIRLQKKRASKSKKVRLLRLRKMKRFAWEMGAIKNQILLIQSQPLPQQYHDRQAT